MLKIKTPWNAKLYPTKGEVNNQPSETVPDQTMPIQEILARYASGLPIEGERVPVYHGEEDDSIDMARLDLSERYALIEANRQRIQDMQLDLQKQQAKTKQLALRAQLLKEIEEEQKNTTPSTPQP